MDERAQTTARRMGDALVLAGFLATLALPIGGRFLDPRADISTVPENRIAAPLPNVRLRTASLLRLPRAFDGWLRDGFGFRGPLIRWHNLVKLFVFGVTPTDEMVVGPDRWLFTTENRALEGHRGLYTLTEAELAVWARVLEARRDWLEARGAHYLFVLGPGKPSIYGEQLPPAIRRGERTPLDQLAAYLGRHSDLRVVDVRRALVDARVGDRDEDWLYYRLGSHWTERGALVAYREIVMRLRDWFPELDSWSESDFERIATDRPRDNMAVQLRVEDFLDQGSVRLRPRRKRRARESAVPASSATVFEVAGGDLPRAVVVHDSFGPALLPFLAEHFSRLRAESETTFRPDVVLEERPDVVIQVMAERRLAAPRPPSSPLDQEGARRAFEEASHVCAQLDTPGAMREVEAWRGTKLDFGTAPDGAPLIVRCRQPGQGVLLPELDLPPGSAPVVRIDVDSPADTHLTLVYGTAGHPEYHVASAIRARLEKGRNVVFLELHATDVVGRMLLRPGVHAGRYGIRRIEVRASAPRRRDP